jgi:large subunit ribosomal protein L24
MTSKKARKQRKRRYQAPAHRRRREVSAHLGPAYLDKEGGKGYPRSVPLRKGDTVLVLRGEAAGREGKVASVDTKAGTVTVEGITYAKADDTKVGKPIHPSNVMITRLDLSDPWRRRRVEKGG